MARALTALLSAAALASFACGGEEVGSGVEPDPDLDEFNRELVPLTTACTFSGTATGLVTVVVQSGELAIISRRSVDSAILVNGVACGAATSVNTKRVLISENSMATGAETVVIDFLNGTFAPGVSANSGIDVNLGAGTDALRIRGSASADTITFGVNGIAFNTDAFRDISLTAVEDYAVSLGAGADTFSGAGNAYGTGSTPFTTAVTVYGGSGADTITGGSGGDTLNGGDGADTLAGGLGDDTMNGDADDDTFNEGTVTSGADTFNGGAGTDTVTYTGRSNALTVTIAAGSNDGESGENDNVTSTIEVLIGGGGADSLTGSLSGETIRGGGGNDTIYGRLGADTLYGEAGNDTFVETSSLAGSGTDVMSGGDGTDTADYGARTSSLTITLDGATAMAGADDGEAGENDNVMNDVENCIGGSLGDTITGNASANVLTGGDGDDTLDGGAGDDTFAEGSASNGADVFIGGAGTDTVDYSGRSAAVTVTLDANANDGASMEGDLCTAADIENVYGGGGDDNITGSALANRIDGNGGADTLSGGDGNDELNGGAANDTLNGGAGDDVLEGGAGTNTLDCGAGEQDIGFNPSGATGCEL